MTARPWMPFYFGDYLADTGHLSTTEHGTYLLLIAHYWMKGGLPTDDHQLARIARLTAAQWQRIKPVVQAFFSDDWKHKRIEFELTEAARISEAGRKGGKASALSRSSANQLKNKELGSTTVERPLNDLTNDSATIGQALQLQPQLQKKKEPSLRDGKRARNGRVPLPDGWRPNGGHVELAQKLHVDLADQEERFRDYLASKAVQYANYDSAFRNFLKNAPKFSGGTNGPGRPRALQDDAKSVSRAVDRLADEMAAGTVTFAERPRLVPVEGQGDLRLLPPRRGAGP